MTVQKLLIVANLDHPAVAPRLQALERWAAKRRLELIISPVRKQVTRTDADLALAIGGDGTFLKTARQAASLGIPLIGFHVGGLGFLPQLSAEELEPALEQVLAGQFHIEERSRLGGEFTDSESSARREFSALNDIVVSNSRSGRFTDIELWCDAEFVASYPGDGVIMATPTGTTAYSLSAGGPIAEPSLPVVVITPLASHQLTIRPLVLDAQHSLRLVARLPARVAADGELCGQLGSGGVLKVGKHPSLTRWVVLESHSNFFARLAKKLNWSQIPYRKGPPSR